MGLVGCYSYLCRLEQHNKDCQTPYFGIVQYVCQLKELQHSVSYDNGGKVLFEPVRTTDTDVLDAGQHTLESVDDGNKEVIECLKGIQVKFQNSSEGYTHIPYRHA